MKNRQPASTRIALWMIAVSLVVIAACLVWMAVQQNRRNHLALEDAPAVEAQSVKSSESGSPPKVRERDSTGHWNSGSPSRVRTTASPVIEPIPTADLPMIQVAATDPAPTGGALLPLAPTAPTNGATVITGRVVMTGKPPQEISYTINDAACGPGNGGKFTPQNFLVSRDGGLANVFVHIRRGLEGLAFPLPAPNSLTLSNCQFESYIFGLMTNQSLQIQNLDKRTEMVDVFSYEGVSFPSVSLVPGKSATFRFPTPETFVKVVNRQRNMVRSYGCITDNPFFTVTDTNGNFTLSNVPPGNFVLEAYHALTHRGKPGVMQSVSVTAGATVSVDFTIPSFADPGRTPSKGEKPMAKN